MYERRCVQDLQPVRPVVDAYMAQGYQWLFDEQVIQYNAQGRDKSYEVRCLVAITKRVCVLLTFWYLFSWLQKLLPEQSHRATLPHGTRR